MQVPRIPDRCTLTRRYLYFLLRHRFAVCTLILLGTLVFGYNASHLRIYTDFFDLYPPAHPHIKLYNEYRHLMGTANILQVVLEVEHGTIYTTETLKKLDSLTRALMDSRGVNPFQVISLTHPGVRDITISAAGITALPIVRKVPESEYELQKIREKIYTNVGVRGVHVSFDDKA